ncbi:MAG: desulfoferrodoxin family protein [Candidatus Omnitrophota bacterium]|nr:hypothetical protein [Candidatus Omnitrophota bacterium]MBU1929696.1 hypothetical protein [Candidatus Omnitrophota bacterium]MBU2035094.1 hypothetical protein [Candidatus Omnitrophota bacterium]MBU2221225.1 hypothetical protein [Candidatus Omnitrophota bacterium]MBU2257987.1 hypothetical protein [Candidatus Omnitrophota bacterium]
MDTFVCKVCGYASFREAPEKCPVCGAAKQAFQLMPDVIKKPIDPNNLNDLEKKHIPVVKISKVCGLVGPGCIDAHIKIGEVMHVMEAKHFIMYVDVYHDYNFLCRVHLTPEKINPVISLHLKVVSGKLLALENCNVHGRWIAEVDL